MLPSLEKDRSSQLNKSGSFLFKEYKTLNAGNKDLLPYKNNDTLGDRLMRRYSNNHCSRINGLNEMMKETIKIEKQESDVSSECSEITPYQSLLDKMLEKQIKDRASERQIKVEKQDKFASQIKEQLLEKQRIKKEALSKMGSVQQLKLNQSTSLFNGTEDLKSIIKSK